MRIAAAVLAAGLVAAGCGGDEDVVGAAVDYADASAVVAALEEGFGCAQPESIIVDPDDPNAVLPGLTSLVNCFWPTEQRPDLPGDLPAALVYTTEADRLAGILSVVVYGCAAAPPVGGYYAYAHGETWVFQSGLGTIDLATMEEVAAALGGEAVATECGDVPWINAAISAQESRDVAEMKALLGEG